MKTYLVTKCKKDGSTPLGQCPEVEIEAEQLEGHNSYQSLMVRFFELYPGWEIVSWGLKVEIQRMKARNNPLGISTLKRGDSITDGEDYYKVYSDPEEVDGIWQVDTTCSGDYVKIFKQGDVIWKEESPWLIKARARSKHAKTETQ